MREGGRRFERRNIGDIGGGGDSPTDQEEDVNTPTHARRSTVT